MPVSGMTVQKKNMKIREYSRLFTLLLFLVLSMGCTGVGMSYNIYIPNFVGYLIILLFSLPLLRVISIVPKVKNR